MNKTSPPPHTQNTPPPGVQHASPATTKKERRPVWLGFSWFDLRLAVLATLLAAVSTQWVLKRQATEIELALREAFKSTARLANAPPDAPQDQIAPAAPRNPPPAGAHALRNPGLTPDFISARLDENPAVVARRLPARARGAIWQVQARLPPGAALLNWLEALRQAIPPAQRPAGFTLINNADLGATLHIQPPQKKPLE
jgi:hypothetical protein